MNKRFVVIKELPKDADSYGIVYIGTGNPADIHEIAGIVFYKQDQQIMSIGDDGNEAPVERF